MIAPMRTAQHNGTILFQGLAEVSRGFDLHIRNADQLSKAQLRALALEYRAVLAAFFDSASEMNQAYDEWVASASPVSTDWECALRATQKSLSEDWPGSQGYQFEIDRVYDLH
jgi:hypothetical protein